MNIELLLVKKEIFTRNNIVMKRLEDNIFCMRFYIKNSKVILKSII